jgi:sugar phosphate isomerase/epimerase
MAQWVDYEKHKNIYMKISCLPVSLFRDIQDGLLSVREYAHEAKKAGLDAIDLGIALIKNHTPVYLESLKDDLEKEDMPLVMITAYPDFSHPDRLQREREKEYFSRDIAVASFLGARYLRMTAGQAHPETEIKTGIKYVTEYFRRMDELSGKYGVKLLFENHTKPGAWKYADFSMPFEIFSEIADNITDTGIGINLDLGNLIVCGQEPLKILKNLYDRIETIHASDMMESGKFSPTALGTGIVPYREIIDFLKLKQFSKWICIEEASFHGMQGVRNAASYIRSLL